LPEFFDLGPQIFANCIVWVGCAHISEIVCAVVVCVVGNQLGRYDVEIVDNAGERWRDIDVPISGSVTNNETLKVVALSLLVNIYELVVLVNLPCEIGNIDASIALT